MAYTVHVYISGKVQGVFYRVWTKKVAEDLDLTGWVRNLPDERVEAVFQGEKKNVDKILDAVSKGPVGATVKNIEISTRVDGDELSDFNIVS